MCLYADVLGFSVAGFDKSGFMRYMDKESLNF